MSKKSVRPAAQPRQAAGDGIELPPLAATQCRLDEDGIVGFGAD
jgi:hypothetical protein